MAYQDMPGGTVHPKAQAENWAKNSIRLADGPADDLIAGTMAFANPGFWPVFALGTVGTLVLMIPPALTSGSASWIATVVSIVVFGLGTSVITGAVFPRLRRPVYLAVTHDEVFGYRVPKMSQQPASAELLFRAPPSAVSIKSRKARKDQKWAVRVVSRGPAAKGRLPELTVERPWLRELYGVVTALHTRGAEVHPALPGITGA